MPATIERKIEREDAFVFEKRWDLLIDDALGEALDDGRFADARFADQHGIVLCAAAKDLDDPLHLVLRVRRADRDALRQLNREVTRKFQQARRF